MQYEVQEVERHGNIIYSIDPFQPHLSPCKLPLHICVFLRMNEKNVFYCFSETYISHDSKTHCLQLVLLKFDIPKSFATNLAVPVCVCFFFLKTFNCGKPIRCILKVFFGKRAISDQENKFEKSLKSL